LNELAITSPDTRRCQEHRRVETFDAAGQLGAEWEDLITIAIRVTFAPNILRANAATNISRELFVNALNPLHSLTYKVM
jgi:hypothetical protein